MFHKNVVPALRQKTIIASHFNAATHQKSSYLHPLFPILVVELHVIARLNPPHYPRLLAGEWRHQYASRGSEVRGSVPQNHAGGLIDAGGVRVDGRGDFEDFDTFTETLWLASDTLNTAHRIK